MYGKFWIDRRLFDNPLWEDKPFSKGQAWIDLIGHANFDNTKVLKGYEIIEVKKGELFTTLKELSERWGWAQSKVSRFLEFLEIENQISQEVKNKGRLIHVENYTFYQEKNEEVKNERKTSEKRVKNERKTSEKPTNLYNKENKENKVNNNARAREDLASLINEQPAELQETYMDFVKMRNKIKAPLTEKALKITITKVNQLSNGNINKAKAILDQSIQRGWRGVFEIKNTEVKGSVDIMDL